MNILKRTKVWILTLFLLLAGCVRHEMEDRPVVYTSFYPLYDLANQLVDDQIDVRTFMPLHQDPHFWEPAPRDLLALTKADVLFINGANLEKWVDQVKENIPNLTIIDLSESVDLITYQGVARKGDFQYLAKVSLTKDTPYQIVFGHTHERSMRFSLGNYDASDKKLVSRAKHVMESPGQKVKQHAELLVQPDTVYDVEMGHESGMISFQVPQSGDYYFVCDRLSQEILSYQLIDGDGQPLETEVLLEGSTTSLDKVTHDPHSWLSIVNAKKYVTTMYHTLSEFYPENQRVFNRNRSKLIESLTLLEQEYKDKFSQRKLDEFVVTHNAYGYIARDFDLSQFPLGELTTNEPPSLYVIQTALNFMQTYHVNTLFYELGRETKQAEVIAEEINGKSQPLVSMEYFIDHDLVEEQNYLSLMRYNLEQIYQGVK